MDARTAHGDTPAAETPNGRVVVGVDGSDASLRALDQATQEGQRHGARLEIVYGWPWDKHDNHASMSAVEAALAPVAARARKRAPGLDVVTSVVAEDAASALVRHGRDATLTVVGTRGHGGFTGMLLGSVSLRVAAHTASPLLVVRGGSEVARTALRYDRVLLGLESDADAPAVAYAFEEAARRKARLQVLHAWTYRQSTPAGLAGAPDKRIQEDLRNRTKAEEAVAAHAMARLREQHPEVEVDVESVRGGPARALIEATVTADLVVIAAHRRTSLGLQLGPVTHALLHHSYCPVLLVPVAASEEPRH
ncbi:nucleotide-binding universal stress UspA family protein [Streptomyces sp. B4I13]|uniref:universal stress protein n=1 Tax=Streptomyces sp. B4I13 TaxID=3042271 RepID=UPI00277FEC93|nr:universal stress protein [Streptomyces sp. B4I13]MDQ0958120.1 nucleotide-binding universal stress UspA family protein [Streptomyces sp. B4I13]